MDYTREVNKYFTCEVQLSKDDATRSEDVAMKIIDDILASVNHENSVFGEPDDIIKVGSHWQKLKVIRYDEFDIGVPLNLPGKVRWKHKGKSRYYDYDSDEDELVDQYASLPPLDPGFFALEYKTNEHSDMAEDFVFDGDLIPVFVRNEFMVLIKNFMRKTHSHGKWKVKANGPAIKVWVNPNGHHGIKLDLTPTVQFNRPMGKWVGWPRRNAKWPSDDKIQQIKSNGADFVPKDNLAWRVSFSRCENDLVKDIDKDGGCRKKCHRIMKKLTKDVWSKEPVKPIPSSYVLKNILFWQCEKYPYKESWESDMIWIRIESMTRKLKHALQKRHLCQYFCPKVNLLDQDLNKRHLKRVIDRIEEFLNDPPEYLKVKPEE